MSVSPLLEIPAIERLELDATAEPTDSMGPNPLVPSGLDWLCPSPPLPPSLQATKGNIECEQADSRIGQPEDDQAGHEFSETSSWTDEPLGVGRGSRLGHRRRRRPLRRPGQVVPPHLMTDTPSKCPGSPRSQAALPLMSRPMTREEWVADEQEAGVAFQKRIENCIRRSREEYVHYGLANLEATERWVRRQEAREDRTPPLVGALYNALVPLRPDLGKVKTPAYLLPDEDMSLPPHNVALLRHLPRLAFIASLRPWAGHQPMHGLLLQVLREELHDEGSAGEVCLTDGLRRCLQQGPHGIQGEKGSDRRPGSPEVSFRVTI